MFERYVVRSRADSPALEKAAQAVEQAAWQSLGYLNYTVAHFDYYGALQQIYADYQLCLVDVESDYVVAASSAVPFFWDEDEPLPAEGWDWVVRTAYETRDMPPNTMGGLAISVPSVHRSQGFARIMIGAMKALCQARGLGKIVIPVRPTLKARHQHIAMHDYVGWKDEAGRLYDPWLRSHVAMGGQIMGLCDRSMVVEEPLGFWETWMDRRIDESGAYELSGGLVPLMVDRQRGIGTYAEPNVWIRYG